MSTSADLPALVAAALLSMAGCASSSRAVEPPPPPVEAGAPLATDSSASSAPVTDAGPPPSAPVSSSPADAGPPPKPRVKVQYIGMHVGGGPFDDATKKPFETAIAPHHPEAAECWAKHVTKTKPFEMGVDLLIEASGGHPKVSNPRVHFDKGDEDGRFVPCMIAVFEGIDFPPLARGKSGVSYSLRFTPTP